jgi:response regulator of citrate/malate metabolism
MESPPKSSIASEGFPRVNSETQNRRDDTRRKILEDELASEQHALDNARLKLKEGQDNPEVSKGADGQTFRNVAKYDEKVSILLEEVSSHEKNVAALKTELSNLK